MDTGYNSPLDFSFIYEEVLFLDETHFGILHLIQTYPIVPLIVYVIIDRSVILT